MWHFPSTRDSWPFAQMSVMNNKWLASYRTRAASISFRQFFLRLSLRQPSGLNVARKSAFWALASKTKLFHSEKLLRDYSMFAAPISMKNQLERTACLCCLIALTGTTSAVTLVTATICCSWRQRYCSTPKPIWKPSIWVSSWEKHHCVGVCRQRHLLGLIGSLISSLSW